MTSRITMEATRQDSPATGPSTSQGGPGRPGGFRTPQSAIGRTKRRRDDAAPRRPAHTMERRAARQPAHRTRGSGRRENAEHRAAAPMIRGEPANSSGGREPRSRAITMARRATGGGAGGSGSRLQRWKTPNCNRAQAQEQPSPRGRAEHRKACIGAGIAEVPQHPAPGPQPRRELE